MNLIYLTSSHIDQLKDQGQMSKKNYFTSSLIVCIHLWTSPRLRSKFLNIEVLSSWITTKIKCLDDFDRCVTWIAYLWRKKLPTFLLHSTFSQVNANFTFQYICNFLHLDYDVSKCEIR